jgi:Flp pilus assembly protein TadD, contains TPR repeats
MKQPTKSARNKGVKAEEPHDIDYLYTAGAEAYAEGDVKKALHFINEVLQANPNHAMAWNIKGNVLDRTGKFEEALCCYDSAIKLDPSNADILFNKAETLEKMGREKDAKRIMGKAVKMEVGD